MASPKPVSSGAIFISVGTPGKLDPGSRKTIRSQVMKGRNRRKRNALVTLALDDAKQPPGQWPNQALDQPLAVTRVGNDFSCIVFPEDLKPYMRELVVRFFTTAKEAMYPPLYCVKPVSLESVWFHYLVEDVACLHTIVFLSSIANDRIRGLPNSIISQTHLSKTLSLLSDRLSIGNRAVTDQTIVIVVLLAIAAIIFGDARAARTHVEGFRKMIEVRGGVNKLLPNRDLRYKACRLDLEYAIFTGTRPFLFDESSPSIHGIHLAATTAGHTEQGVARDARLEAVFRETQALVTAINIAVGTGTKLDLTFFQESMLTTQYRILLLEFPESEWEMEALRLGMIAFGTTVYFRFAEYGREYRHLSEMLATVVKGHPPGDWPRPELVFWLLIVGSISLWKPGSQHFVLEGLEELTYRLNIRSWAEAKALLKSILWIDSLHDDLVRAEFGGLDLPFRFG